MKEELFRESSLKKLTSLEKLNTCIRVTNPGAWLVIGSVFLLLVSAGIWRATASLKTSVPIVGVVHGGQLHAFVSPEKAKELSEGMAVEKNGESIGVLAEIKGEPVRREKAGGDYLTDYFRDTELEKWNVELVISIKGKCTEGTGISCRIVTRETELLKYIIE